MNTNKNNNYNSGVLEDIENPPIDFNDNMFYNDESDKNNLNLNLNNDENTSNNVIYATTTNNNNPCRPKLDEINIQVNLFIHRKRNRKFANPKKENAILF